MRTGIIGVGRIGSVLARLLAGTGHQVSVANGSGPRKLSGLLGELGPGAFAGTPAEAAARSELIVLMVPFGRGGEVLSAADTDGKFLVDSMNAFPEPDTGQGGARRATSELVAELHPGARVVKSFNTMHFETLARAAGRAGESRLAHFAAGDDDQAKKVVSGLAAQLGFAAVDTGSLHDGGILQQPGGPLFDKPLTERQAHAVLGF